MKVITTEIACSLDPAALQQRTGTLWEFIGRANERTELKNGFEFTFGPGSANLQELVQIVDLERSCCKFLRFIITVEPADGPVRLEVSGPEGTKEFLASLFRPPEKQFQYGCP